jgi:chromosome segregation ATPase
LNNLIASNMQDEKANDKLRNQEVQAREALVKVQRENDVLLNSVTQIERQIADRRKLTTQDQQELEELERSRSILQKEIIKMETQFKFHNERLSKKDREIEAYEMKISETNETLQNLQKEIATLEKDKEKYGKQSALSNSKYLHSLEEIKLKGNLISEYQKKNVETETRLKEQQRLYEAVRSDRNTYSKNLS